jgi:hypothetical protein
LILYSPTVLVLRYGNKLWSEQSYPCFAVARYNTNLIRRTVEFVVADIKDIKLESRGLCSTRNHVQTKEVIQALAEGPTIFDNCEVGN